MTIISTEVFPQKHTHTNNKLQPRPPRECNLSPGRNAFLPIQLMNNTWARSNTKFEYYNALSLQSNTTINPTCNAVGWQRKLTWRQLTNPVTSTQADICLSRLRKRRSRQMHEDNSTVATTPCRTASTSVLCRTAELHENLYGKIAK